MAEKNQAQDGSATPIDEVFARFEAASGALRSTASKLAKAKSEMAAGKPRAALQRVIEFVEKLNEFPQLPTKSELLDQLHTAFHAITEHSGKTTRTSLMTAANARGLECRTHSDGLIVGPCLVVIDEKREVARIQYSKADVGGALPLDPDTILDEVQALTKYLSEPVDVTDVEKRLDEATRVAAVRKGRTTAGEIRVELPQLFRELSVIHGFGSKTPYSFVRFVVELKTFLQSDANLKATRRYRLEPAVIENAKNTAKAFFLPNEILQGAGEATAFQAIVV